MAIRQIVKTGSEVLRYRAKEVTEFDSRLHTLLDDLKDTMIEANGVGIAAPQVGITKRVCIVCVDGENIYELVNPVIIKESGSQISLEGCLSVPGRNGDVKRPLKMTVDAYNRNGELMRYKVDEYLAVAFSHEIDHLNGVLFTDKIIEGSEIEKPKRPTKKNGDFV